MNAVLFWIAIDTEMLLLPDPDRAYDIPDTESLGEDMGKDRSEQGTET